MLLADINSFFLTTLGNKMLDSISLADENAPETHSKKNTVYISP
ncbi:hypothetical protein JPSP33_18000 [Staphylococcus pseudintermedius]